eukprot:9237307-Pyramimonas_sp.AAC.1
MRRASVLGAGLGWKVTQYWNGPGASLGGGECIAASSTHFDFYLLYCSIADASRDTCAYLFQAPRTLHGALNSLSRAPAGAGSRGRQAAGIFPKTSLQPARAGRCEKCNSYAQIT